MKIFLILVTTLMISSVYAADFYSLKAKDIKGNMVNMEKFKGKLILVVNTASKCGYTPQFDGLESLYKNYKDKGFVVLGFPCNQFMGQDPKSNEEISKFCKLKYGVSFPMFSKIKVNGEEAHPIFKYLKSQKSGVLGTKAIKWNFTKFLISKTGKVLNRYGSNTKPIELKTIIEENL